MGTEIRALIQLPNGPLDTDVELPEGVDIREPHNRRLLAKILWQIVCASYQTELVEQLFDYTGGDPIGWIDANMALTRIGEAK